MKRVFQIAMKDLILVSRDKLGMFFILIFPIIMALFFGSVMGGGSSGGGNILVSITDEDQSEMSAAFVEGLKKQGQIDIIELERVEAANRIRRGRLPAMLVIPKDFDETAGVMWKEAPSILLGVDPSRKATAGMLQGYIMQATGELMAKRFGDTDEMKTLIKDQREQIANADNLSPVMKPLLTTMMTSLDSVFDQMEQVRENDAAEGGDDEDGDGGGFNMQLAKIETLDINAEADPNVKIPVIRKIGSSWDISFPQAMLWGVLSCVAGFAISIAQERSNGTYTRLQVAPISRFQIVAGKALACFIALVGVITMLALIGVMLGMRPKRWDLLVLAIGCTAFCFVGMMMVFALVGKTEQAVSGATWGINMLMAMFGGCMLPIAFMKPFMKSVSNFTPVKWSILAIEGAVWRQFTLAEMLLPCGILFAIGVIGLLAGSRLIARA